MSFSNPAIPPIAPMGPPGPPGPPDPDCNCFIMFWRPPMPPICLKIKQIDERKEESCRVRTLELRYPHARNIIPKGMNPYVNERNKISGSFYYNFMLIKTYLRTLGSIILAICWLSCAICWGLTFLDMSPPLKRPLIPPIFLTTYKQQADYFITPQIPVLYSKTLISRCLRK